MKKIYIYIIYRYIRYVNKHVFLGGGELLSFFVVLSGFVGNFLGDM